MDLCEKSDDLFFTADSNVSAEVNKVEVESDNLGNASQSNVKKVCFTLDNGASARADEDINSFQATESVNGENYGRILEPVSEVKLNGDEKAVNTVSINNCSQLRERLNSFSIDDSEKSDSPTGSGIEELLDSFDSNGKRRRHIFILSSAGKPVYTRHGCEDKLVTLFGVMQALVSVVQDSDDTLQAIKCGETFIAFLSEGPIILVGVSHSNDSLEYLRKKLNYIYSQVVSILTLTQLTKIFEERHNYDLRRLLSGSERIIDHLLNFTETRPEFMLDSISCLPMPQSARDAVSNSIVSACSKIKNLVFAILMGNDRIISIVSLKKYKLEPCDIHLVCNLVSSSESFKTAESWTPICLPKFNPSGYLHAHVSYLSECPACLLLLTVEKDSFFELSEAKSKIAQKLVQNQSMVILKSALASKSLPSVKNIDVPYVRHLIYKSSVHSQLFYTEIIEPYETDEKWSDLLSKYEHLYRCMMSSTQPLKVLYHQLANEVMLGWITKKFELYVVFEPLVQKLDCINAVDKILQWVQKEEEKLFMMTLCYFN